MYDENEISDLKRESKWRKHQERRRNRMIANGEDWELEEEQEDEE